MTNAYEQKEKHKISLKLNGFRFVDVHVYVSTYLGIFDDFRSQIKGLIGGNSADWMYSPKWLHESVLVPCFSIGCILAKKYPAKVPYFVNGIKSKSWRSAKANIQTKYNTIAFLISYEMVLEYFKLMQKMKQDEINKIHLEGIFKNRYITRNGHVHLAKYSKLNFRSYAKYTVTKRSPMYFARLDHDKLSPILKSLPLAYLKVPMYDKSGLEYGWGESFASSSETLQGLYDYKAFWDNAYEDFRNLNIDGNWLTLPKALRPSNFYFPIFHGVSLLEHNIFMERDVLKLSAHYSSFDIHQENVNEVLDELLRIAKEVVPAEPESPPPIEPHQYDKVVTEAPVATLPRLPMLNLGLDLHEHPATRQFQRQPEDYNRLSQSSLQARRSLPLNPRGEPIHDPASYFTVQQSVPTQRLFGYLLHASNSFDMATYC